MQVAGSLGSARGPEALESARRTLTTNQIGRFVAALFGLIALICYFQPWVSGTLPVVGESSFTGPELARGEAIRRVDQASFGKPVAGATQNPSAAPAAGASSGGLVLPTRMPTVAAGAAVSGGGGLTLPTRVPTVAAGAGGGTGFSGAAVTPVNAPGSTGATADSSFSAPQIGRQITYTEPDKIPQTLLYIVPLAAAGAAIFPLVWGRLGDPHDRRHGRSWTLILAVGGTLGVGYVLYKVVAAPHPNDLLSPGEAQSAAWGLWGTFVAFVLSAISMVFAWSQPHFTEVDS